MMECYWLALVALDPLAEIKHTEDEWNENPQKKEYMTIPHI